MCGGGLCALRRDLVGTRAPRAVGGRVVDGIVSVGLGAAAPIFALAVLAAVLLRNSAELLLQRLVGRWKQSVQAPEQVWRVQPVVMHG